MSVQNPVIASIDGATRRIFLAQGVTEFFPIEDLYAEYRYLRRTDESLRRWEPLLRAEGNVPKGAGAFTPRYVVLLDGTKIVPFDEADQLNQRGDIITDNPDVDATLYDISGLTTAKPIFIQPSEAETIQLNSSQIEYSSFDNGITIDANSGFSGTGFPNGTRQQPVNNIVDARAIALSRGFDTFYIKGNYTFDTGDNVENFIIFGQNSNKSTLTFNPGALTAGVDLHNATVTGTFDNAATFEECRLLDIQFVQGYAWKCVLVGEFTLAGTGETQFLECWDGVVGTNVASPSINFNGSGRSAAIRGYKGDIALKNKTGPENVEINGTSGGTVTIESTVTNGTIRLSGSVEPVIEAGVTATIDTKQVDFPELQQLSSFNNAIHIDSVNGVDSIQFPAGTHQTPVKTMSNVLALAAERGIETVEVTGQLVITDTDISELTFRGENALSSVVVLSGTGNTTNNTKFENMILTGRLNGPVYCEKIGVETISNIGATSFPTIFNECIFRADNGATPAMQFNPGTNIQNIHFINCRSGVPGSETSTIDVNGSDAEFAIRDYGGGIKLINYTAGQPSTVEIGAGGQLKVDNSNTNGTLQFRGNGKLVGTTGGLIIDSGAATQVLINSIRKAVLNRVEFDTVTEIATIYEDDGVTVFREFDLTDGSRIPQ